MIWCPVEWPTSTNPTTVAKLKTKQSSKNATKVGILGLVLLFLMAAVVLGYGLWSKRIMVSQAATNAETFLKEVITGEIPVMLQVDGETKVIPTTAKNVQEFLVKQGVTLRPEDQTVPALTSLLKKDMRIQVVRVDIKTVVHEEPIPFITERIPNPEMPRGFTRKAKEGVAGVQKETWEIRYEDGVETSRACVNKEMIREPMNALVQYGTLSNVSRGGQNLHFSRAYEMVATGYTYTGYNTATGIPPSPGVAAVDPRVIPLGTRLYVEGYGNVTALDTGGDIKGNRIDLFYETESQALQWGVRNTKVYVLDK